MNARSGHRRTALTAVGAALLLGVTAACTGGGVSPVASDAPTPTSDAPTPTPSPTATDAAGVLAGYGLALPEDAQDAAVEPRPDDDETTGRYVVTFTAPADAVGTMCTDAGINGPLPALTLRPDELELFEVTESPADGRLCSGSADDVRQQIRVLFSGDPAAVRVVLYTMPPR